MARIPEAPIPNGPQAPQPSYVIPSAMSEAFNSIEQFGNELANKTTAMAAEKQATIDQQQAGTDRSVAIDDSGFPSIYAEAYNKTANLIFGSAKQNQLDQGLQKLYASNPNDPTSFANAANEFKASYMSNVPLQFQADYLKNFNEAVGQYQTKVTANNILFQHNTAKAAVQDRLNTIQNQIYSATVSQGDDALNSPDVVNKLAESQTLLRQAGDPNQLGGALLQPEEIEQWNRQSKAQIKMGEITHQFNSTPFPQQANFLVNLQSNGIPGGELNQQQFDSLIGNLRGQWRDAYNSHRMDEMELRQDVDDATKALGIGITPDNIDTLTKRVQASGDPSLMHKLNTYTAVANDINAFQKQSLAGMKSELDGDLDKLNAGQGTVADVVAFKQKQEIMQQAAEQLATDPLRFAASRRVIPQAATAPIDLENTAQLQGRVQALRQTEATYSVTPSLFTKSETEVYAKQWPALSSDQKVQFLDAVNKAGLTPPEQVATYKAFQKEAPDIAFFAQVLKDPNMRATAVKAMDGLDVLKANPELIDKDKLGETQIASDLVSVMPHDGNGNLLDPSGQTLRTLTTAINGIYASNAVRNPSAVAPVPAQVQQNADKAFAEFFGYADKSDMPTVNGHAVIPLERGMPAGLTRDIWNSITDDDLKAANGGALPVDQAGAQSHPIDASTITRSGFPVYSGVPGRYYLGIPNNQGGFFLARGQNGTPFIWDYGSNATQLKARVNNQTIIPGAPIAP